MVITGILMASVTIFGCKAIVWLNRLAIPGLVVLLAWLTYRIVTVYSDKLDFSQATGDISFFAVINLLPAGMATPLFWVRTMAGMSSRRGRLSGLRSA